VLRHEIRCLKSNKSVHHQSLTLCEVRHIDSFIQQSFKGILTNIHLNGTESIVTHNNLCIITLNLLSYMFRLTFYRWAIRYKRKIIHVLHLI